MASSYLKAIFKNGEPIAAHKTGHGSIQRIIQAVNHREKIIVYGKGNQEGICSIAILILVFRYFNADFDYFLIPRGGNQETLISDVKTHLNFYSPGVILSLDDNFTKTVEGTLKQGSTDLISGECWQSSSQDQKTRDPLIKSVFLLAKELSKSYDTENFNRYVDLVYLGADLEVLSQDELLKQGLERLNVSTNYGIKALKKMIKDDIMVIKTMVEPKDNPWSMVDNSRIIIELLTTEDFHRAEQIAKYLMNC